MRYTCLASNAQTEHVLVLEEAMAIAAVVLGKSEQ
jgi:hypothetical protein